MARGDSSGFAVFGGCLGFIIIAVLSLAPTAFVLWMLYLLVEWVIHH